MASLARLARVAAYFKSARAARTPGSRAHLDVGGYGLRSDCAGSARGAGCGAEPHRARPAGGRPDWAQLGGRGLERSLADAQATSRCAHGAVARADAAGDAAASAAAAAC